MNKHFTPDTEEEIREWLSKLDFELENGELHREFIYPEQVLGLKILLEKQDKELTKLTDPNESLDAQIERKYFELRQLQEKRAAKIREANQQKLGKMGGALERADAFLAEVMLKKAQNEVNEVREARIAASTEARKLLAERSFSKDSSLEIDDDMLDRAKEARCDEE